MVRMKHSPRRQDELRAMSLSPERNTKDREQEITLAPSVVTETRDMKTQPLPNQKCRDTTHLVARVKGLALNPLKEKMLVLIVGQMPPKTPGLGRLRESNTILLIMEWMAHITKGGLASIALVNGRTYTASQESH